MSARESSLTSSAAAQEAPRAAQTAPAAPTPACTTFPRIEPGAAPTAPAAEDACSRPLRIAVPKGSLNEGSLAALEGAGLDVSCLRNPGRQMMFQVAGNQVGGTADVPGMRMDVEYVIVRPTDAPVFVANGGADVGIAGEDSIVEADLDVVELVDLAFGGCRFVVAEPAGSRERIEAACRRRGFLKVATKYPNVTRAYYDRIGVQADILKLHGNIELAPATGMADRIVDITATGTSLRENDLVVVDEVFPSTARLIASPSAARIDPRVRILAAALEAVVAREG